jgi:filamentous hemagglutinin family protein
MEIKTSVFATSNNVEKIIPPLQSRFFIVRLEPYTYEQLFDITASHYIDNRSQNAVEELNKLGGAKVILATVPSGKAMTEILGGLAVNGKLVVIGASDEPIQVPPSLMISGLRSLIGWQAGTSIDSQDTLSFSVVSGVRSMNEDFPLEHAAEAYDHMMSGKAKYRCVLTTGN